VDGRIGAPAAVSDLDDEQHVRWRCNKRGSGELHSSNEFHGAVDISSLLAFVLMVLSNKAIGITASLREEYHLP
jgi:hypothetical protein